MEDLTISKLREGNWSAAISLLEAELIKAPDDAVIAYNLIVSYLKVEDYAKANVIFKEYKRALEPSDREEILKDLNKAKAPRELKKELPTKTKQIDGQIKEFGWFKSDTKFNQVIGLNKVKRELNERIVGAMQNPELYSRYGAAISGGLILYGPPGGGKTLLAKAVGGEAKGDMLIVNISEIVAKFMGDTSKNLSKVFDQAREAGPSLIFIDEIDSVAQSRAGASETMTSPEERRILDTFLTELDGASKSNKGVFLLGASNIPWACDSAFLRSGRFGHSIYVGSPQLKDRIALFKFYLKDKNKKKIRYTKLGLISFGFSPADIQKICENAATHKAAATHFDKAPESPITTMDLMIQIREMGKPTLLSWYAETALELKKLPVEKANQYRALLNDIAFWQKSGKSRMIMYKILASLIP